MSCCCYSCNCQLTKLAGTGLLFLIPEPHPHAPPPASGHFYGLSGEPEGTHPRTSPQDRMGRTRQELSRSNGK